MILGALGYLAATDPATAPAEAQAECLRALERASAVSTAVRARYLNAFTANQGYCADADYSPTGWLVNKTGVTKGAARAHQRWARRACAHPRIEAALAEGTVVTESMAQQICQWTGKLPESCRDAADEILVAAARAGARREDLAALAAEIYARSRPDDDDDNQEMAFEDRQVRVETTFEGAGVMAGDLTPECAAIVTAVLESLSAPMGAEDTRTREQRYHDALQEAMRRLVASGLLPERAGQPVKLWVHMSLAELRALDDGSVLQDQWIGEMAARWAALRAAAADGSGSDGGAWLDGKAAGAAACDATITPVVTGDVDPGGLDRLVRLCIELDRLEHGARPAAAGDHTGEDPARQPPEPACPAVPAEPAPGHHRPGRRPAVRSGRPGQFPAPAAARGQAVRAKPAAGYRLQQDHPARHPQRGRAAGPALPLARRLHPARGRLPGPPRQAPGPRRADQPGRLRAAVLLPPPGGDSPLGLDPGAEPRRDHHGPQPRWRQGLAQSWATRPRRLTTPRDRARTGVGGVTGWVIRPVTPPAAESVTPRRPRAQLQLRPGRPRTPVRRRCSPSQTRCLPYRRWAPPRRECLRRHRG